MFSSLPRRLATGTGSVAALSGRCLSTAGRPSGLALRTAAAATASPSPSPSPLAAQQKRAFRLGTGFYGGPAHTSLPNAEPTQMHKAPHPGPGPDFNVLVIGAGNINFGSDEGPWNHSFRLEHKLGPRLKVVGLIDPSLERSESVLHKKRNSFVNSAYKDTKKFRDLKEALEGLTEKEKPQVVIVGAPPAYRGTEQPGRDLERKLTQAFPNVALFIEKPVSTGPVDQAMIVAKELEKTGTIVSVGYMLRYLKVVQKMKQIIEENNLNVMATNARYIMAYEHTAKLDWWDKSQTCGPIVEQATHFCDLSRYFGGEVDISSVLAHSVEYYEKPGKLSKIPVDESKVAPENRIPRITGASWKYTSGAVGQLTHAVALQGKCTNYSTELEVYADGYQLRLVDPYNHPMLVMRRPGDDHEEVIRIPNDDPFFSEISNLIDNIELGEGTAPILSSYLDAVKTYELTWAIRTASEKNRKIPAGGFPQ